MKKITFYCSIIVALSACQTKNTDTQTDTLTTHSDTLATVTNHSPQTLCFEEKFGKDITTVRLVIEGDDVTGTMEWLPWEKDQARGTLKGKKNGNEIIADYEYMIEGSNESEEKIFILEDNKLQIKGGELEDKNGKLVLKNPATATIDQTLVKVECP